MAKFKCDICGKTFEGYGNNPAPIEGKVCCDECNKTYVIPARLKQLKAAFHLDDDIEGVNAKIGELDKVRQTGTLDEDAVEEVAENDAESLGGARVKEVRAAIGFLIKDEIEAIEGYDNVIEDTGISGEYLKVLEEIRNDEIDHVNKLNSLYKTFTSGAIEEDNELQDDLMGSLHNVATEITKLSTAAEDKAPRRVRRHVKDSDTVNDIGVVSLGQKYRFEEKYGNQQLTVTDIGENVKLSLDNTNTFIKIPREKFEKLLKEKRLNNIDIELIEQYGAIKTARDRNTVRDADGVFAFGWTKGVVSGNLMPASGDRAVIRLDGRAAQDQWKQWAIEWARKNGFNGVSVGKLVTHDPDDKYAQSIIPLIKF